MLLLILQTLYVQFFFIISRQFCYFFILIVYNYNKLVPTPTTQAHYYQLIVLFP